PTRPEERRSMTAPQSEDPTNPPAATPRATAQPATAQPATPQPADAAPGPLPVPEVARLGGAVLDRVSSIVVGMRQPLRTALATILAGGHVLFEDVPGLGKTLAARTLAGALGLDFRRLQCTPDLLPADITGSYTFDPGTTEFVF